MGLIDDGKVPLALGRDERIAGTLGAQEVAADDAPVEDVPQVLGGIGIED